MCVCVYHRYLLFTCIAYLECSITLIISYLTPFSFLLQGLSMLPCHYTDYSKFLLHRTQNLLIGGKYLSFIIVFVYVLALLTCNESLEILIERYICKQNKIQKRDICIYIYGWCGVLLALLTERWAFIRME